MPDSIIAVDIRQSISASINLRIIFSISLEERRPCTTPIFISEGKKLSISFLTLSIVSIRL